MNSLWQNFLTQQGAQLQDGTVQHFRDFKTELQAARDGTILCDLSQFGVLRVQGEEAQKFLQNLLSNDINAVNASSSQLSAFNTAKGRMLATFLIWQQAGDYLLQVHRSLAAAMQKKLAMYILRAKVKVSDASDDVICLGLSGTHAASLLQQQFGIALDTDGAVAATHVLTIIRVTASRYLLSTSAASAPAVWEKLASSAKPAGSACWDWLNIRDGIPVVTAATQEQFVLQMANLDLLNGVSFRKGCYPGQEIVARTHYLGKQKRRMFLAHVISSTAPVPGNELFSDSMAGQACGMVINAITSPDGGFDLLAVMQISSHAANDVHLGSASGERLQFKPLPYALPAEENL